MEQIYRFYVEKKEGFNLEDQSLLQTIQNYLGLSQFEKVRIFNRYDVSGLTTEEATTVAKTILSEPQTDRLYTETLPEDILGPHVFAIEALPGQYDQRADSAEKSIALISAATPVVKAAKVYSLYGTGHCDDVEKIKNYLVNPVETRLASLEKPLTLEDYIEEPEATFTIDGFLQGDTDTLQAIINHYGLAMDLDDIIFMQAHFAEQEHREPTITELKLIDTYWSDHCRHTTFMTEIQAVDIADPVVAKAYQHYLAVREEVYGKETTRKISLMDLGTLGAKALKKRGILTRLDESEEINACSVQVRIETTKGPQDWLYMFKNETHNHPTEIEPFGGAATCLGGAIRDPLSGRSYVYQGLRLTGGANPLKPLSETLPGKLPQRRISTLSAQGFSSYGNQIGLSTGLVDEVYHPGYEAKRMEVGAVIGAAPQENVVRQAPVAGDVVILLGGRTGRDGCGGATGSSKAHTEDSLVTCSAEVQKGNPVEERKIQRLFRNSAVSKLIKRCNDFGAGGVSVAIGELAGGVKIHLERVPKKYEGLSATELAISESQERMAVVVAAKNADQFIQAADRENLEATIVADVTAEQRLVMMYKNEVIVDLDRAFLDSAGAPKTTTIQVPLLTQNQSVVLSTPSFGERVLALAKDLNICSKKGLMEQFDSTIGAGSVLVPFGGIYQATPTQVMAAKIPLLDGETNACSIFTYGFDPALSATNPFFGGYYAVVESIAKLIAAGGTLADVYLTFQEYFPNLQNNPRRWGLPLASLLGAFEAQIAFGVGAVGGKDSMSGTFHELDVPPTLISFATSVTEAKRIISPEFKKAGHEVYLFVPAKNADGLLDHEAYLHQVGVIEKLIQDGQIISAWAISRGGVVEGLLKMGFGNQIGVALRDELPEKLLFAQNHGGMILETTVPLVQHQLLGHTTTDALLTYQGISLGFAEIQSTWEETLEEVFPTKTAAQGEVEKVSYPQRVSYSATAKILRPKAVIPVFPGTNCEYDTMRAVARAGGEADVVVITNRTYTHLQDSLKRFAQALESAQMMILPGGFSFGDEPDGSAKFIAAFLKYPMITESVHNLLYKQDGLVLGICNGFQALVKSGLLPSGQISQVTHDSPTLTFNQIGRHQSRYVLTRIASVHSPWLNLVDVGDVHAIPVSHGEGRFVCTPEQFRTYADNGQIGMQYVDFAGNPTLSSDFNPNGSMMAIEGLLSPDGRILGKMGHSERVGEYVAKNIPGAKDQGLFASAIQYYRQ